MPHAYATSVASIQMVAEISVECDAHTVGSYCHESVANAAGSMASVVLTYWGCTGHPS